jgi:dTDP-4-dehydrorhamnose 3,5-epimerase
MNVSIDGVVIKELETHSDERGFFRELIRVTDDFFEEGFGQWSHSLVREGVLKAWHLHRVQVDWWYVVSGVLRVGLCDMRDDSPTSKTVMDFLMGDQQSACVVRIPPGVAHGYRAVQGPANIFYMTYRVYDPDDIIHLDYDDPAIDFDWLQEPALT